MKKLISLILIVSFFPSLVSAFIFEGQQYDVDYTDENTKEDLIIRSDKRTYGAWDRVPVYFSVTNESEQGQNVTIQFRFQKEEKINVISELIYQEEYVVEEPIFEELESLCLNKEAILEPCLIQGKQIGVNYLTKYRDYWKPLETNQATNKVSEKDFGEFNREKEITYFIPANETRYFKANFDIENIRAQGQFLIEAFGDKGAYGVLDPWYDSAFTYCRKMTMTAGGTSGGVATTTTSGFPLVATSTIADLKHADHGGKIQVLNTASTTPVDVVITNGTDCNNDGGSLVDFFFEKHATTTGAFVLWAQAPDISSTTSKTLLMYYGNSSATDQSNEKGVFDAQGERGVWTLGHNGVATTTTPDFRDSTANRNDGTSVTMNSADLVDGQLDGALDFEGTNDRVVAPDSSSLDITGQVSISAWMKTDSVSSQTGDIINKGDDGVSANNYGISHINDEIWFVMYTSGGSFCSLATTNADLVANRFYHVAIAYNDAANTVNMYLNGSARTVSVPTGCDPRTNSIVANARSLYIGWDSGSAGEQMDGVLDDIRVYNSTLHVQDILTIYNNTVSSTVFWTFGAEETEAGGAPTTDSVALDIIWFYFDE